MTFLLALLILVQDAATKEDVLKLVKEGASEETILARIGKASYKLTADEIVELKKAGVGDKVLARMIAGAKELKAANVSHKPVHLSVREGTIDIAFAQGVEVRPGGTVEIAAAGEYALTVEGRATTYKVRTPATLTFRGCDIAQVEVLTVEIEDASGRTTCLLDSKEKVLPSQQALPVVRYGPPRIEALRRHPRPWFPFISHNVILGAGAGAIIGHQSGHRTRGAVIGAGAGLLLDFLGTGPY